jgi:hypothetical protein
MSFFVEPIASGRRSAPLWEAPWMREPEATGCNSSQLFQMLTGVESHVVGKHVKIKFRQAVGDEDWSWRNGVNAGALHATSQGHARI